MTGKLSEFTAFPKRTILRRLPAWLFLAAMAATSCVHAAEDPYLKALQSEAGKVEDLTKAQAEQRKVQEAVARQQAAPQPAAAPQTAATAPAPSASAAGSRADLERALRDQFPGTYALYQKFSEADKQLVVKEYEASKATGIARYLPVINKVVQVSVARY